MSDMYQQYKLKHKLYSVIYSQHMKYNLQDQALYKFCINYGKNNMQKLQYSYISYQHNFDIQIKYYLNMLSSQKHNYRKYQLSYYQTLIQYKYQHNWHFINTFHSDIVGNILIFTRNSNKYFKNNILNKNLNNFCMFYHNNLDLFLEGKCQHKQNYKHKFYNSCSQPMPVHYMYYIEDCKLNRSQQSDQKYLSNNHLNMSDNLCLDLNLYKNSKAIHNYHNILQFH